MRKIIHIDMDAFYASVEQRDNPALRGKPVAVGHSSKRGVVTAASYEAREYGVRSAMPGHMALERCPQIIFTPARREVYVQVSRQIRAIFHKYTSLVEPLSLDEAYLDVTVNHINMPSATIIAQRIKQEIWEQTGLTASAGVSINKFLAKIASDQLKPNGLFVITAQQSERFVEELRVEQFWGVGPVTAKKMHALNIHTGADIKQLSREFLIEHFGKAGESYYFNARAIDHRKVEPNRARKSVGAENTYREDIDSREELASRLRPIAEEVWERSSKSDFMGRTITLKVKFSDFEQITRSKTFLQFIDEFELLWQTAIELLEIVDLSRRKVRLLGLTMSNTQEVEQPSVYQLQFDFNVRNSAEE